MNVPPPICSKSEAKVFSYQQNQYQPPAAQSAETSGVAPYVRLATMDVSELQERCEYIVTTFSYPDRQSFAGFVGKEIHDMNMAGCFITPSDLFNHIVEVVSGTSATATCFTPEELEAWLLKLNNEHNSEATLLQEIVRAYTPKFWDYYRTQVSILNT